MRWEPRRGKHSGEAAAGRIAIAAEARSPERCSQRPHDRQLRKSNDLKYLKYGDLRRRRY